MKIWFDKAAGLVHSENDTGDKEFTSVEGGWVKDFSPVTYPENSTDVLIFDSNKADVGPEEARIDAALEVIKERHNLCETFDVAVEQAKNLPLLDRLKYVAETFDGLEDYSRLYEELVAELNKDEYVPPTAPSKGDYVRVTFHNGTEYKGEVTFVGTASGFQGFYLGGVMRWAIILPTADSRYWESEPQNAVVKIEHVNRPAKVPEIGRWIEAQTKDGETHTIKVTENRNVSQGYVSLGRGAPSARFWVVRTDGRDNPFTRNWVVEWKYTTAPVEPKEIDGYWVVRYDDGLVMAHRTKESTVQRSTGIVSARSIKGASESIATCAEPDNETYRQYIPALLAIIKYIEQEASQDD